MADLSDVENAIVSAVTQALYPNGVTNASVVGATCRVYRGWPSPAGLNTDLAGGVVNATIFPATSPGSVSDLYFEGSVGEIPPIGLVATVSNQTVAFSGPISSNLMVGVIVDGRPFSYSTSIHDTPESIAANLAAQIGSYHIASAIGSSLVVQNASKLVARVVSNGTVTRGLRRQSREIRTICWCPTSFLRDSVSKYIDIALAAGPFLGLADGTSAHVSYVSTQVYDQSQNALLYRRDLSYGYEYATVQSLTAPAMLFGELTKNGVLAVL